MRPLPPPPFMYTHSWSPLCVFYTLPTFTPASSVLQLTVPQCSRVFPHCVHQRNRVLCLSSYQALSPPRVPQLAVRATSPSFYMALCHSIRTARSVVCVLDKSLLLAQVILKLITLLLQPPECRGYRCVPCPARRHSRQFSEL